MSNRPAILVVDHDLARRFALIDGLRQDFESEALPEGSDLLRYVRSRQPAVVLLFVHPFHPSQAYRNCRWLKTDLHPIRYVGIVNAGGPPRDPTGVGDHDLADGYFEGPPDPEAILAFARDLWAGESPVHVSPRPLGVLNRLLRLFVK
jgi:hypothetical protein